MARTDRFSGLSEFLAVADHASFRAAAADLGVTRAAVSQAVQALEGRLGRRLFQRTTRSVALTDAGAKLLETLRPAADQIGHTLDEVSGEADRPVGRLRLTVPRIAFDLVLTRVLPELRDRFPAIAVELDINDASVDLASRRYDAGIRIGEWVERDMVAVKLTPAFQWMVVASPDYLARHGRPRRPRDLLQHECIRYRFPTAASVFRWEFVDAGEPFTLDAPGHLTVNDHLSMIALARQGLGLAYTADLVARQDLDSGALMQILREFVPRRQGLYLYFPATARNEPKLRAFIEVATRIQRSLLPGRARVRRVKP
ncbi:MAG TPA: LysR family transcriptional regulator [Xanthobacteraceae bacterium]|jgi:DNA-binding transcriptional LysR family regulator